MIVGGSIHGNVKRIEINAGTIHVEIAHGTVITAEKSAVFASAQDATGNKA